MQNKKNRSSSKGSNQTFAAGRTLNPPQTAGKTQHGDGTNQGASFQEQDPQRRLGSFEGRGEHARTGSRGHQ